MGVKKGKLEILLFNGNLKSTYDAWEFECGSEKFLILRDSENTGSVARTHAGVSAIKEEIEALFVGKESPNPVCTFIEAMTEVPGAGGSSPLDVYPVGIEITTTDTAFNPMKVWGGTWTVTPAGAKRVWKRTA